MAAKYAASSVLFDIGILVLTLQSEGSSCMDGIIIIISTFPIMPRWHDILVVHADTDFSRLSRWAIVSILLAAAVIHTLLCACMQGLHSVT